MSTVIDSEWTKQSPYNQFFNFIAPRANRYAVLIKCIESLNLNPTVISVAGNRHIFVFPPSKKQLRSSGGVFPFAGEDPFLLTAHYDRVQGSPGANDNSIAVFMLLDTAVRLIQQGIEKWIIVFTDKEELKAGESFKEQGSFTLSEKLISWGLARTKNYIFDACGRGDTFIFSTTTDTILKASDRPNVIKVRDSIGQLRNHAIETVGWMGLEKVLLAPTPFSDDVGFLRAGLAAQTITMLPTEEANQYGTLLSSRPEFADLLISGRVKEPPERHRLPETWRTLNNASDTPARLTPEFFEQVVRFAVELCRG